jgi:phage terminase large subunit GpA-like protein
LGANTVIQTLPPRNAWAPRERLTVTEWANKHRQLTSGNMPGPYDVRLTPYLQGVMDAFTEPGVSIVDFVKSSQVGGTEAVNNMLGYSIDHQPGPVLVVYPTEKDSKEECRDRIVPMIEQSPALARHIPGPGWDTLDQLDLDVLRLHMAWAKAPRTLIRRAIRWAFCDEIDNCDKQAGNLGNTLKLILKRLTTYKGRCKCVLNSTPTVEHATAWQTWLISDRREYHVPCPKCGTYQVLKFSQIKVPEKERDPQRIRKLDLAWYECESCNAKLNDAKHKRVMVERGVWVTHSERITQKLPCTRRRVVERAVFDHPDRWLPSIAGDPPLTDIAGFHINALYSPWRDWSDILAEWFECKDDPESLRVFVNATLGEPWKEAIEEIKVSELEEKRDAGLPRDLVPTEAQALILYADVQKDHIFYGVRAWGFLRENWLIRHGTVMTFDELLAVAGHVFPREGSGQGLAPMYLAIDSGHRTKEVYEFARANRGVYCCKGQQAPVYSVRPSQVKYPVGRSTTVREVMLFHVNTSMYKEMLHRMIHTPSGQPGCFHLYAEAEDDYCVQLTSEQQVWKTVSVGRAKRRVAVWEPKTAHAPNHYLDAEVYGLAIADHRGLLAMTKESVAAQTAQQPHTSEPSTDRGRQSRRIGRSTLGWRPRKLISR